MIIDIDDYKDLFEIYKITLVNGVYKSSLPNCLFNSNNRVKDDEYFMFKLQHEFNHFEYFINRFVFDKSGKAKPIVYSINSKFNLYNNKIESNSFLPIENIIKSFYDGLDYNYEYTAFSFNYHFGEGKIKSIFGEKFDFVYRYPNGREMYYSKINYDDNEVYIFTKNYDRFSFHVKYNNLWFKTNDVNLYLHYYSGDFLDPMNIACTKAISKSIFNYKSFPELLNKESFYKLMSKVETEVVFS